MADRVLRPVAARLGTALLTVAVMAVLVEAALTMLLGGDAVSALEQHDRDTLIDSITAVASSTYSTGRPGWSDVDLQAALALAALSNTHLAITDDQRRTVISNLGTGPGATDVATRPILLHGRQIGTVQVAFTGRTLHQPVDDLRRAFAAAVVAAAGIAAITALVLTMLVATRVTRPMAGLTRAARAMSRGDRRARVGTLPHASSELAQLGAALDEMADSLAREETLRREQASDLAHELRRPVAVLQAMSEATIEGVVPLDRAHALSLHEEILQLAGMVEDLQTLSAVRETSLEVRLRRCDLAVVAETVAAAWQPRFDAVGLTFTHQLRSAAVDTDPQRIHQVVANLLANALQYTPSGGAVAMSLTLDATHARLAVQDTGVGIDPSELPHLFTRRWRSPRAGQSTGSGIGLTVAAELVHAHGGSIEVTSSLGHGSRFTIVLPLADGRPGR